jgi:two-component system, NtrC family, response regulator PilR
MIQHLNVLIVDDDPSIRELLQVHLESRGYTVVVRADGVEGLATLDTQDIDLIISDIKMAKMNGFEFVRAARETHPKVGIVLMTAYGAEYGLSEALAAGADGYITKPFTLKKFSLIFEKAYWAALSRQDWWEAHDDGVAAENQY